MNLVIDFGNTLVKIAVFQGGSLIKKKISLRHDILKNLEDIIKAHDAIEHAILSSVVKVPLKLIQKVEAKCPLYILNKDLPQVFINRYATPGSLGQDRIALISAACKFYSGQNTLVIDAGTCITYDFKNGDNEYLGGAISPGLQMRYKALHTFTDKLPLLVPEEGVGLTGNSTNSSIHAGVVLGITAEIDGMIASYLTQYKDLIIIFTGGDAQFLCKRLKNSIFANSNFLLEGLNYILEFNTSHD